MIEYIQYCLLFALFCFRFTSINLYDDTQQHVCLTWENTQRVTKLYKDGQFTEQVTNDATKNYALKANGALAKTLLLIVVKPFMADWQVSTCGIKFCPKATLPLSTQIAAYLMVLLLTGLY